MWSMNSCLHGAPWCKRDSPHQPSVRGIPESHMEMGEGEGKFCQEKGLPSGDPEAWAEFAGDLACVPLKFEVLENGEAGS